MAENILKSTVTVVCIFVGFDGEQLHILLNDKKKLLAAHLQQDQNLETALQLLCERYFALQPQNYIQLSASNLPINDVADENTLCINYACLCNMEKHALGENKNTAEWVAWHQISKLSPEAFSLVNSAYQWLSEQIRYKPLAFDLLPENFALPDMQNLYEILLKTDFDKRNFRRKLMYMDFVEETDAVRQLYGHRPARLYRFNKALYEKAVENGFRFML
ncbi:MAG: hypothetical protein R2798_12575 [Chitinophagales bacterium]|nr:hypothetical protein [Bacteroidota bacterium]MCB9042548.1 hypothetical protein [Chitinophagales bacterium]